MGVEDAYELAYREAVRALEHQRADLAEVRGRASMLLAAASIAVSLLGQQSFRTVPPAAWAAVGCFGLLATCVLVIVWPRGEWLLDLDPYAVLAAHLSTSDPAAADLALDLIAHMASSRRANSRRLMQIAHAFRIGACLLAIQLVLTILVAGATL